VKRWYARVCGAESFVAQLTLWGMVLLIFVAGVARLVGSPINWAVDLSTCLFAWSCFLSADVAWRENKLMRVDVFLRLFPERLRWFLGFLNYCVLVGFFLYLIIFGLYLSYTTRVRTFQGIPGFSYTWVTLSVPVGALLLLMTAIIKIRGELAENRP